MIKVACVLLTLNEEANIERALKQFRPHVAYEVVLDGGSTDNTVKLAKTIADRVEHHVFSGSFAEEKNYARTLVPKDCLWILWADADEMWDKDFLEKLQTFIAQAKRDRIGSCRFPRINLPGAMNFPDYQVRLFLNSRDILWRGNLHEVPFIVTENVPLDRADDTSRKKTLGVCTFDEYPIIHLPRRKDVSRIWWKP